MLYWLSLALRAPVFQSLQEWYWPLKDKPLAAWWLFAPLGLACGGAAFAAARFAARPAAALALIALCGWWFQIGLGLSEGRGYDIFREQILSVGHAEFAKVAAREGSMLEVARDYEALVAPGRLGKYAKSKPPGHLLFYMLMDRIASLGAEDRSNEARLDRLVSLAAGILPILSMLAIIPLYLLARLYADSSASLLACALFVFAPNVGLATLHLDHALYPTLFLLPLWLFARALRAGRGLDAALAGAMAALAFYVSFSLIPLLPICACIAAAETFAARRNAKPIARAIIASALFLAGLIAVLVLSRVVLGYDVMHRYSGAMRFHREWKTVDFTPGVMLYIALLDYAEFAVWIGLPLAIVFADAALGSVAGAAIGDLAPERLWGAILVVVFIMLGVFGKTLAEVARLWLFLVPLVCLVVARSIRERYPDRFSLAASLLLAFQFITALFIKRFQDFY